MNRVNAFYFLSQFIASTLKIAKLDFTSEMKYRTERHQTLDPEQRRPQTRAHSTCLTCHEANEAFPRNRVSQLSRQGLWTTAGTFLQQQPDKD